MKLKIITLVIAFANTCLTTSGSEIIERLKRDVNVSSPDEGKLFDLIKFSFNLGNFSDVILFSQKLTPHYSKQLLYERTISFIALQKISEARALGIIETAKIETIIANITNLDEKSKDIGVIVNELLPLRNRNLPPENLAKAALQALRKLQESESKRFISSLFIKEIVSQRNSDWFKAENKSNPYCDELIKCLKLVDFLE